MSERAELELEGAELEPGQTIRLVCPFCKGGRSREKSLSLTSAPDGALLFNCYRAKCSSAGALGGVTRALRREPQARRSKAKPDITGRLTRLPLDMGPLWEAVGRDELRLIGRAKWDPETNRIALPSYGPSASLRGFVLRAPPGSALVPKVLSWPITDECPLSWNSVYRGDDRVVVVEDIPSAIALATRSVRAVALQGTHLTDEAIDELIEEATDIVFALDRDAFQKSVSLAKKLRLHFRTCVPLLLEKDFKDMNEEEMERCLSEISWLRSSNLGSPTTE